MRWLPRAWSLARKASSAASKRRKAQALDAAASLEADAVEVEPIRPALLARSVVWAVMIALAIGLVLSAALLITSLSGSGDDEDTGAQGGPSTPVPAAGACTYTGVPDSVTLYYAPLSDPTQFKVTVPGGQPYPVIQQRGDHVLLQISDQDTAWADRSAGTLDGDCENVPVDQTPFTAFPTVCSLTTAGQILLHSDPSLANATGTVPPGSHPVTAATGGSYYVWLDDSYTGWVSGTGAELSGPCSSLPAQPGPPM